MQNDSNGKRLPGCVSGVRKATWFGVAWIVIAILSGCDPQDNTPTTPLQVAAVNNDPAAAQNAISNGAQVNGTNASGRTALHLAAWYGNVAVAQTLIANGANVNARDKYKLTPLDLAQNQGHAQMVQMLESYGGVQ
jgi:ankyrin repeat protein